MSRVGLTLLIVLTSTIVRAESPTERLGQQANELTSSTESAWGLPGVVEPVLIVSLAPRIDGTLRTIHVAEGERVVQGQRLAQLDTQIAEATVAVARATAESLADLHGAEAQRRQAERFWKRVDQAHQSGASSEVEHDQARANLEQAEQRVIAAEEVHRQAAAHLALEEAKLAAHHLVAPFPGKVVRILGRPGQTTTHTDAVLILAALDRLQVDIHAPAAWIENLKPGQSYALAAGAPISKTLVAKLMSVEPHVDAATQTCRCRFEISNTDEKLPSGFTVHFTNPSAMPPAVTVSIH